jgi:hypothetical protein
MFINHTYSVKLRAYYLIIKFIYTTHLEGIQYQLHNLYHLITTIVIIY